MNSSQDTRQGNDTSPSTQPAERQEQTDPQLTELRGLTDSKEELEPVLTDGQKAPDKEPPADVNE